MAGADHLFPEVHRAAVAVQGVDGGAAGEAHGQERRRPKPTARRGHHRVQHGPHQIVVRVGEAEHRGGDEGGDLGGEKEAGDPDIHRGC